MSSGPPLFKGASGTTLQSRRPPESDATERPPRDRLPSACMTRCARGSSPEGLADSHIALRGHEGGAAFGGLELEPALEHDDGSGLAVVAGPSAEAGADPCRIGERAPGVRVALSFGLAFEAAGLPGARLASASLVRARMSATRSA